MTTPDFKSAALEYSRKNCCPPACEIERVLRLGAEMVAVEVVQDLKRNLSEMKENRRQIEAGTNHGHSQTENENPISK
jgi:hypothetical protein